MLLFRVTLKDNNGTVIIQTSGTEKVYDPTQPKTVNPFLAYTINGTVSNVSWLMNISNLSTYWRMNIYIW